MAIRCKFTCVRADPTSYGSEEVTLYPVTPTEGTPENEKFWKATPNGAVHLSIDNPGAQGQFKVGESYYVDFTTELEDAARQEAFERLRQSATNDHSGDEPSGDA